MKYIKAYRKVIQKNYIYENDILVYESLIDEFTSNVFKDFDSRFNKLDIISRITRLINGEIVNERKAKLHFTQNTEVHRDLISFKRTKQSKRVFKTSY